MTTYTIKLKERREVAEGTMAFIFERPRGFTYKAGQFMDVTLINPPETDAEGNLRTFSIASAPHESDLMIATRMRDTAFKRVLKLLPIGSEVTFAGPLGAFTLHNDTSRPAVFLMGGIGITPARSIVMDAAERKLANRIFLFYSNRRPEDAPFLDEVTEAAKRNPNYHLIPTMTEMAKSVKPWSGETSFIDKAMLQKYLDDLLAPIYYIAGPPSMVEALHAMLNAAGVDDDTIRIEEFAGY